MITLWKSTFLFRQVTRPDGVWSRPRRIWTGTRQRHLRGCSDSFDVSVNHVAERSLSVLLSALTELESFLISHCILQKLSAFLKWNNSEIGYSRCLFFPCHSLTHTHVLHTFSTQTDKPMFKPPPFSLCCVFFFLFFFSPQWYETLDRQCSTQLSAIPIQTQSDKMVTLSAHWQFIPN